MDKFGYRIKYYRQQMNYTQEQLAEKAKITTNYLSAIERGIKVPRLETFVSIANILDVSSDELLSDVLRRGGQVQSCILEEQIEELPARDQKRIRRILEVLIEEAKESDEESRTGTR